MRLLLERLQKADTYTHGKLSINGEYCCECIEDRERGLAATMLESEIKDKKVYGKTAIPTGTYKIDMNTVSPKFKDRSWAKPYGGKLPRLIGVKGFEGVLIHVGNTASDSLGCILVNTSVNNGVGTGSTQAFHKLMNILLEAKVLGEDIEIKIV